MREFARGFYFSKEWRRVRATSWSGTWAYASSAGAPERSYTTRNISRRRISTIQRSRSARIISSSFVGIVTDSPTPTTYQQSGGLMFDEDGNLVEREFLS